MTYTPRPNGPFKGLKLIDADSHLTEPTDLWTSRAPAKYRDRVPQTGIDRSDGMSYWWVDGKKLSKDSSIAFVRKNGDKIAYYGADIMGGPREDIHAAATEAKARVDLLDEIRAALDELEPLLLGRVVDIEMARLRVLADRALFQRGFNELVGSHLEFLGNRLDAVFRAAQKGTHTAVAREEADRYVVYTYLIVGDLLSLHE